MTAPTAAVQKPLGKAGVAFFGSLCLGTFGLGVWQTKRYGEKVEQLARRDAAMALPPSDDLYNDNDNDDAVVVGGSRRICLRGTFDHAREFYVGPRGSPLRQSTGSLGVPQHGYFVFTPLMLLSSTTSSSTEGPATVLVNRGWVPRSKVDGSKNRPRRQGVDRDGTPFAPHQAPVVGDWDRPSGVVTITAVKASVEEPRFLVAGHDDCLSTRKLFWMDRPAMLVLGGVAMDSPLLTQIQDDDDDQVVIDGRGQGAAVVSSSPVVDKNDLARPSVDQIDVPKVSPAVHAGYAVTWYGLSLAGVLLTRKLILRGR